METTSWNIYGEHWIDGKRRYRLVEHVRGTFEDADRRRKQLRDTHQYGMLRILPARTEGVAG